MKVRHKSKLLSNILTVLEESASYYIVVGPQGEGTVAVEKASWEPIPTETWRDVTAECEVKGVDLFYHGGLVVAEHYRLRKVPVFDEGGQNLLNRWAFIVEKREP